MPDLRSQLETWRGRRLWLLGVGNVERGDDGFGVRLVEALRERLARRPSTPPALSVAPQAWSRRAQGNRPWVRAVDVGTCPERYVGMAARAGCEDLVFADAIDFGEAPGSLLLAHTEELLARPVTTSTHRVPLSVLMQYAEGLGVRAWLLGVQPASLRPGSELSPEVAGTLGAVVQLLGEALGGDEESPEADACRDDDSSPVTSRARARARARSRADGDAGVDP